MFALSTLILTTLGTILPIVLQNTGVIGPNGAKLESTLTNLGLNLYGSIKTATTKTQDYLAALATLKGVLEALKATTGISPTVLQQIENIDDDITAAMVGYATAAQGYNAANYEPVELVNVPA